MIYVDNLIEWPTKIRCFREGSCHMFARIADLEALHAFATRIGLRRAWFQHAGKGTAHYDLTPAKRRAAVAAGAIELDRNAAVAIWKENRAALAACITGENRLMATIDQQTENCCEHGDHPAPIGKRFCSPECQTCDAADTPTDDAECAGICQGMPQ